jgi:hypothetical protein
MHINIPTLYNIKRHMRKISEQALRSLLRNYRKFN